MYETVKKYKDHPAVLTWGIGNEVYLNIATNAEKEAYSKLLEKICKEIKILDKNHPITSVEAWTFGLDWWQKLVPSIDIYGLNSYGAGANYLQTELDKRNIDKPYIITEFGVTGEWDIKQEKNGVKVEPNDLEKFDAIANGYNEWIANKSKNLGVFVFHYSNNKNHMAPWLLTHFDGKKRPQYWAIRKAYLNKNPENYVPKIEQFSVSKEKEKSNIWIDVQLKVTDVENDNLTFTFYYNHRKGSRKRKDQINTLNFKGSYESGFKIQLPKVHGGIKIYANVTDAFNNMGIATTSVFVTDKEEQKKRFLVPKVNLPFYVYKDGKNNPYSPSAQMGNYQSMQIDLQQNKEVYKGDASLKITYNAPSNWFGLGLVDPANDWGNVLGGYDITGAKKFSFWAKANQDYVKATVGFGLIDKNKPFYDTAKKSKEIIITKKWKKYTIKLKRLDLSCIRSGFTIFSSGFQDTREIYIDNIIFE